MQLKHELTAESVRLDNTIRNGNDITAIKAARTRWENKHRAYWREVHRAREVMDKERLTSEEVAAKFGIDPLDLGEVT